MDQIRGLCRVCRVLAVLVKVTHREDRSSLLGKVPISYIPYILLRVYLCKLKFSLIYSWDASQFWNGNGEVYFHQAGVI
jgi:hypothetical protein